MRSMTRLAAPARAQNKPGAQNRRQREQRNRPTSLISPICVSPEAWSLPRVRLLFLPCNRYACLAPPEIVHPPKRVELGANVDVGCRPGVGNAANNRLDNINERIARYEGDQQVKDATVVLESYNIKDGSIVKVTC